MWQEENNALSKEYTFPDFKTALEFVSKVGGLAEEQNHHPDIAFGWGKVKITLTTHSAGGVTEQDRALASKIDAL